MLNQPLPSREMDTEIDDAAAHHGSRRRSERVPLHADVEILQPSQTVGVVLNASTGGLRIAVDGPVYVDDVCALRITLGNDDSTVTRARVIWVREMRDGFLAGLELLHH